MTPAEIAEWKRESEASVMEPRVGDVFMDHFVRVFRVAERNGRHLKVSKPVPHGPDNYIWGEPQPMTLDEFRRYLSYGTRPGVWCEVAMPRPAINGSVPTEKP